MWYRNRAHQQTTQRTSDNYFLTRHGRRTDHTLGQRRLSPAKKTHQACHHHNGRPLHRRRRWTTTSPAPTSTPATASRLSNRTATLSFPTSSIPRTPVVTPTSAPTAPEVSTTACVSATVSNFLGRGTRGRVCLISDYWGQQRGRGVVRRGGLRGVLVLLLASRGDVQGLGYNPSSGGVGAASTFSL